MPTCTNPMVHLQTYIFNLFCLKKDLLDNSQLQKWQEHFGKILY